MSNYNIYFSPTGGTKKVADILVKNFAGECQEIDICKEIAPITLEPQDVCVISVPSYGGRVPAVAIRRLKKISANGAKAILNCVYGNREWEDTCTELQDALEEVGFVCVAAVAAVAEHSIFRQFATGRPDADDAAQLSDFAKQIQRKLDGNQFGELVLTGSHGTYKEFGGAAFKPEGNESCNGCGLCAKECPVSAICFDDPRRTDKEMCISCMRCVDNCPQHARDFDPEFMKVMSDKMEARLSGHKENYLFL